MIQEAVKEILTDFLLKEAEAQKLEDLKQITLGIKIHIPEGKDTPELYYYTLVDDKFGRYVELDEVLGG